MPLRGRAADLALAGGAVVVVVLLLAAVEGILRTAAPAALRRGPAGHPHVYSETYGWDLRPGARYQGRSGEWITVNRDGYRGRPHSPSPGPGVTRVVLLGDSITFGTGVADDVVFSSILESAHPRLEAVNLAVDGYGTDQAFLKLRGPGLGHAPHAVVLNVCVRNDAYDNGLPVALYDGRSPKPYFTLEGGALRLHDGHLRLDRRRRLAVRVRERSYLVNALLQPFEAPLAAPAGEGPEPADWAQRRAALQSRMPELLRLTRRLVEEVAVTCRTRGIRLLLLLHPDRRAFQEGSEVTAALAAMPGLETVDLAAEYRRQGLSYEEMTIDGIGHLGRRGHEVVAALIASRLERR
ncbi:MAG TPA: SGNH/GDSL hydrolase family protein [Vicinamibacteria bacterium]|nr:SGNH/GDSL hydrolase family protein [Vicinamibacteria bacterium]